MTQYRSEIEKICALVKYKSENMNSTIIFDKIKNRAAILFHNAFGFYQPNNTNHCFIIAKLQEELTDGELSLIREKTDCQYINQIEWLGRSFLTLDYKDHNKRDRIFNCLLELSIPFSTYNNLEATFNKKNNDNRYTDVQAELKSIENFDCLKNISERLALDSFNKHAFLHEWNWKSDQGKNFCRRLRKMLNKPEYCGKPEKHDYRLWDIFKDVNFDTLMTNEEYSNLFGISIDDNCYQSNNPEIQNIGETLENTEIDECMICLENVPDTMVLPCEHNVVCKSCSDKLRETNDAKICVRCRREIEYVLD